MRRIALLIIGCLLTTSALAQSYDASHLPYSDAPQDRLTAVAVSALTAEGILQGYPDGTFRPYQLVNRAEFTKIVMMALGPIPSLEGPSCFPDVELGQWFASPVCFAKELGLVEGNSRTDVPPDQWLFAPTRAVNYAEAAAILVRGFELPRHSMPGAAWYQPFLAAALAEGVSLPGVAPEHALTRGEVAQVVASFLAWKRGNLPVLREAQSGQMPPASSSSPLSSSSFSSSSSSSRQQVSSSPANATYDPMSDTSAVSSILRLGTVSPMLGAVKIFNNLEPFTVEDITVTFTGTVPSVDQVRIFASADRRFLGGASRDTDDPSSFTLHQDSGILSVEKREEASVYARAILSDYTSGGVSGETVHIDHFTVEGRGDWSNRRYSQSSTETFQASETARSSFTAIRNAGLANDVLVSGQGRTLGSFLFEGVRGDGSADLRVTDLAFEVGTSGSVSLSNLALGASGSPDRFSCTLAGSTATCASIPDAFGSVSGGTRTLTLYGDVTVPANSVHAGLQLSLTPAGTPSSAGAITWTDGTTSFSWVPFDESVLRSTYYSQ